MRRYRLESLGNTLERSATKCGLGPQRLSDSFQFSNKRHLELDLAWQESTEYDESNYKYFKVQKESNITKINEKEFAGRTENRNVLKGRK